MKEKRKSKLDTPRENKRQRVEDSRDEPVSKLQLYQQVLEQIANIEDNGRQIAQLFLRLPSKKVYSDYYTLVGNPISLHEIKEKVKKSVYDSPSEFKNDFKLMLTNAKIYNAKGSEVVKDAEQICRVVEERVESWIKEKQDDEFNQTLGELTSQFHSVLDELIAYKQRGRVLSEIFMDEPSRRQYPEYYQVINNATSFNSVRKMVNKGQLKTIDSFLDAVRLIFDNATTFNEESSIIYTDAVALSKQLQSKIDKLHKLISIPQGYEEWTGQQSLLPSGTGIKLRVKELAPPPKLKLSLRRSQSGKSTEAAALQDDVSSREMSGDPELDENELKQRQPLDGSNGGEIKDKDDRRNHNDQDNEHDDDENDAKSFEEGDNDEENDEDEGEEGEEDEDEDEDEQELDESVLGEEVSNRRPPGKTASDAIIRIVNITSVVPNTTRYQQSKNPVPPPSLMNAFQISFPGLDKYSVQSYSFALPSFQHTLNLSVLLHESLHNRLYLLNVVHNYRKILPISSSASNPFADHTKPLKDRFEIRLTHGLNHIEIIAQASPLNSRGTTRHTAQSQQMINMEGSEQEKLTLWVMLNRN